MRSKKGSRSKMCKSTKKLLTLLHFSAKRKIKCMPPFEIVDAKMIIIHIQKTNKKELLLKIRMHFLMKELCKRVFRVTIELKTLLL